MKEKVYSVIWDTDSTKREKEKTKSTSQKKKKKRLSHLVRLVWLGGKERIINI